MSPKIAVNRAEKRRSGFYYPLLIFFTCLASKVIPALQGRLTADACGYLDIVRNILAGRGPVISYNIYQYWPGSADYPALPYMQSLFSLLVTPVYLLFKTVVSVNLFNAGIAAMSATLVYFLILPRYKTRVAFWSAMLVGLSPQMCETAPVPWTEQLHLFFVLIAAFLMLRAMESGSQWSLFLSGIAMGGNYFVHVSNLFVVLAFLMGLFLWRGFSKQCLRWATAFLLGFGAVFIPYELFCLSQYHAFYPLYPNQSVVWRMSGTVEATYETIPPSLRIPPLGIKRKLMMGLRSFPRHVASFVRHIGLVSLFLIPLSVWMWRRRRPLEILLWITGVTNIIFYAVAFYWLPRLENASVFRYSLISIVCFLPLVMMMVDDIAAQLPGISLKISSRAVFLYFVFLFVVAYGRDLVDQNLFYMSPQYIAQKHREAELTRLVFRRIQAHTERRGLVATEADTIQKIFPLDRPIVSLPFANALTPGKMKQFLAVYQPRCVLVAKNQDRYRKFLEEFHYQLVFQRERYLVFMER